MIFLELATESLTKSITITMEGVILPILMLI